MYSKVIFHFLMFPGRFVSRFRLQFKTRTLGPRSTLQVYAKIDRVDRPTDYTAKQSMEKPNAKRLRTTQIKNVTLDRPNFRSRKIGRYRGTVEKRRFNPDLIIADRIIVRSNSTFQPETIVESFYFFVFHPLRYFRQMFR